MNEQQFSLHIRKALDESAEKLPYKVTHRLSAAREQALSRMQAETVGFASLANAQAVVGSSGRGGPRSGEETGLLWRLAGTVLPVLIVVVGLAFMEILDLDEKADELAEIDAGILDDEVPIDVYTDRGFGVFLKSNRQ